jgi:hypothetical protein
LTASFLEFKVVFEDEEFINGDDYDDALAKGWSD